MFLPSHSHIPIEISVIIQSTSNLFSAKNHHLMCHQSTMRLDGCMCVHRISKLLIGHRCVLWPAIIRTGGPTYLTISDDKRPINLTALKYDSRTNNGRRGKRDVPWMSWTLRSPIRSCWITSGTLMISWPQISSFRFQKNEPDARSAIAAKNFSVQRSVSTET